MAVIRGALGTLSLALVFAWLAIGGSLSLIGVAAASRLWPARRLRLVSWWCRLSSHMTLLLLKTGGARYRRTGAIESGRPGIVVMNHQSLLDIPTATVMSSPLVPGFITRKRYARASVPVISTALRLADCPVIDPHEDREGAIEVLRRAVWQERALLIFPESHRTQTGELQPFRTAGLLAMLSERRVPVWLLATDGFWAGRRLVDFVTNVHRIRGRTELVGRFDPPAAEADLPAFIEHLHGALGAHLARMRDEAGQPGAAPESDAAL